MAAFQLVQFLLKQVTGKTMLMFAVGTLLNDGLLVCICKRHLQTLAQRQNGWMSFTQFALG